MWFSVHLPSPAIHPGQVHFGVSMCAHLHSPGLRVCRGSYLLWLPLQATQLSYGVGVRCGTGADGVVSGGVCLRGLLPFPFPFVGVGVDSVVGVCGGCSAMSDVSVPIVG